MRRNEEYTKQSPKGLIIKLAMGMAFGLVLSVLCLMVISMLVIMKVIPEDNMRLFVPAAVVIGAIVPGFVCSKAVNKRALPVGILGGLIYTGILYVLGIFVFMRMMPEGMVLYNMLAGILGGAIGGYLSVRRKGRR